MQDNSNFWYTYVLLSHKDKKHYVGFSNNLKERLLRHSKGKVLSTKNRQPLELIYFEASKSKQRAIKRERYFKTGFGRRFLSESI